MLEVLLFSRRFMGVTNLYYAVERVAVDQLHGLPASRGEEPDVAGSWRGGRGW